MNLTMIAIPTLFFLTLMAVGKKQRIWPIIVIMGITILFGMVNGSQGRPGVPPSPFAFMFDNNQIVRVLGSFLLVSIYLAKFKLTSLKNGVLGTLWVIPLLMLLYYIGSGIEGLSDGFLGVLVKMADVVGFYLLVHRYSLSPDIRSKFLKGVAYIGLVFIIINLFALLMDPIHSFRAERFRGIIFSVNWMGTYLAFFLVPFFSQYFLGERKMKILWLGTLIITGIFLILTGSRGAILTAFVTFLIFIWFVPKTRMSGSISKKGIFSISILLGIGLSISMMMYPEWFTVAEGRLGSGLDSRSATFEAGWDKWYNYGFYLGMLDESYGVESIYLTMLYVYGIIGLSSLLAVILHLLLKAKNISKRFNSLEGPAGMAILVGFSVNCLFEGLYFGTMSAFNLFLYIGLGLLFSVRQRQEASIGNGVLKI